MNYNTFYSLYTIHVCIQWESSCSQLTTPQMPHSTLTWLHACSLQQQLSHTEEADNLLSSQMCTEKNTHTSATLRTCQHWSHTASDPSLACSTNERNAHTDTYSDTVKAASPWRRLEHSGSNVGKVFRLFSSWYNRTLYRSVKAWSRLHVYDLQIPLRSKHVNCLTNCASVLCVAHNKPGSATELCSHWRGNAMSSRPSLTH